MKPQANLWLEPLVESDSSLNHKILNLTIFQQHF